MELSPDKPGALSGDDSLLCIAGRIAEGLHPSMVYSDTDYLNTVKAELRKLLKQGSVWMIYNMFTLYLLSGSQLQVVYTVTYMYMCTVTYMYMCTITYMYMYTVTYMYMCTVTYMYMYVLLYHTAAVVTSPIPRPLVLECSLTWIL